MEPPAVAPAGRGGAWVAPGSCVCLRVAARGDGRADGRPSWGPALGPGACDSEAELEAALDFLSGGGAPAAETRGVRCRGDADALALAAALEAEDRGLEAALARPLPGGGGAAATLGRRLLAALSPSSTSGRGAEAGGAPPPLLRWLVRREVARRGSPPDFRGLGAEFRGWFYLAWPAGEGRGVGEVACHGRLLRVTVLSVAPDPRVAYVMGFVGADEAAHLVALGRSALHPSRVVAREVPGPQLGGGAGEPPEEGARGGVGRRGTAERGPPEAGNRRPSPRPASCQTPRGGAGVRVAERTSHNGLLPKSDSVVRAVVQRASHLAGLTPSHAEAVQIVRYRPGEEYREHCDWFDPEGAQYAAKVAQGGQRLMSVFCYLQECARGGETAFPRLGLRFAPRRGDAVVWFNLDEEGREDVRTLHQGCPVLDGEKWGMNVWLRQRPRRAGGGGERGPRPPAPRAGIDFSCAAEKVLDLHAEE